MHNGTPSLLEHRFSRGTGVTAAALKPVTSDWQNPNSLRIKCNFKTLRGKEFCFEWKYRAAGSMVKANVARHF
jgi:hypothetical protein